MHFLKNILCKVQNKSRKLKTFLAVSTMLLLYKDIDVSESQGALFSLPDASPLISDWGLFTLINWTQRFFFELVPYNS